jgi:hypothetical protein
MAITVKDKINTLGCCSQPIHHELHWLWIPEPVTFKLCMLVHRCLEGTAPPYLSSCFNSSLMLLLIVFCNCLQLFSSLFLHPLINTGRQVVLCCRSTSLEQSAHARSKFLNTLSFLMRNYNTSLCELLLTILHHIQLPIVAFTDSFLFHFFYLPFSGSI